MSELWRRGRGMNTWLGEGSFERKEREEEKVKKKLDDCEQARRRALKDGKYADFSTL